MPELPPTGGKVLYSLLRADERLSQRELAERGGVSTQSVRNNRDILETLGLVSVDNGWRLELSFRTDAERRAGIVPDAVGITFVDAVSELLETAIVGLIGNLEISDILFIVKVVIYELWE